MNLSGINLEIIKECFYTILRGNEQDSRLAAREARKLLYSSRGEKDKYKKNFNPLSLKLRTGKKAGAVTPRPCRWR